MKLKTIETQAIDNNLDTSDESFRSFLELAGLGDCVDYYCDGGRKDDADGCYHDDDDDDGESKGGIPSTTAAAARRVRNAKASHLVSILLFVVGSVLYLVLAVWDYRWARSVQGWPEDVLLDYEDDITYNNYRLKLLYYGSVAGVAEAEGGGRSRRTLLGRMRGDWEFISPWVNFFHPDFDFPSKVRKRMHTTCPVGRFSPYLESFCALVSLEASSLSLRQFLHCHYFSPQPP
jgi:hypothetical protein